MFGAVFVSNSGRIASRPFASAILCGMKQDRCKRILVSIPQLTYQHRQALEGVLKYAHENKAVLWEMYFDTETAIKRRFPDIKRFQIDGILAYVDDIAFRDAIIASDISAVLYDSTIAVRKIKPPKRKNIIITAHDFEAEGRFAAHYFIDRHYQHFAYVGEAEGSVPADICRQKGFTDELKKHGFVCQTDPLTLNQKRIAPVDERILLEKWLRSLQRRTGLFAVRDMRAKTLLASAVAANVHIPEHVSVLGFDNDALLCETCTPQLSSLSADIPSFGYECAQELDRLMAGACGGVIVRSPQLQIVTRASSSMDAIGDPFVSKALTWIRAHRSENPTVCSIASGIGCSVKPLQRRFRDVLGRSIGDEIKQQKVAAAIDQLRMTGKGIAQIAGDCGFSSASHLCLCIKKRTGHTPKFYRDFSR